MTSSGPGFEEVWAKAGKKLNMGKSCVRFKDLDDLVLDVIGEAIRRVLTREYIECVESARAAAGSRRAKPSKAEASPGARKSTINKHIYLYNIYCQFVSRSLGRAPRVLRFASILCASV